ncbi:hypothetical protein AVEN_105569-1 [Araneus ventricosus]|uniref:Uncharacterized protein n=1 Tax=Araneus ventricosus TaxID=182803 RepID=A0A4Y2TI59_ARAVE|nr:hypothetical protein AVEN_105569-1 [Araneus ventricosus]
MQAWHVSELEDPFKKRVDANPAICVLTMILFFFLALSSLSNAEPVFRNMEPLSTTPDAHNVYKRDSGTGFTVSGSCTTSRSGGVNDVRNTGSGPINITYRNCGSRNICEKLANDVYIAGSGNVYISTSSTNNCGALVNNVHDSGSGQIYLKYGIEREEEHQEITSNESDTDDEGTNDTHEEQGMTLTTTTDPRNLHLSRAEVIPIYIDLLQKVRKVVKLFKRSPTKHDMYLQSCERRYRQRIKPYFKLPLSLEQSSGYDRQIS